MRRRPLLPLPLRREATPTGVPETCPQRTASSAHRRFDWPWWLLLTAAGTDSAAAARASEPALPFPRSPGILLLRVSFKALGGGRLPPSPCCPCAPTGATKRNSGGPLAGQPHPAGNRQTAGMKPHCAPPPPRAGQHRVGLSWCQAAPSRDEGERAGRVLTGLTGNGLGRAASQAEEEAPRLSSALVEGEAGPPSLGASRDQEGQGAGRSFRPPSRGGGDLLPPSQRFARQTLQGPAPDSRGGGAAGEPPQGLWPATNRSLLN